MAEINDGIPVLTQGWFDSDAMRPVKYIHYVPVIQLQKSWISEILAFRLQDRIEAQQRLCEKIIKQREMNNAQ